MNNGKVELEAHFKSGRFLSGVSKQRWRLIEHQWPLAYVEVSARDGRWIALRFDCSGYPDLPPTAMPWDITEQHQLPAHLWPAGGRVTQVFNPGWKNGQALYIPCDRQSIEGHTGWLNEYSWLIWKPARGLLQYIEAVHEVLQSKDLICEAS